MRAVRWVAALVLIASVLALAGCGTSGGAGGKLEDTRWVLKTYDSKGVTMQAPGGISIDALFSGGKVSGFSGVNTYRGSYKLSGSKLSIGKLASTLIAGPQDLMDAEQAYIAALQKTGSYTADAGSLALFDQGGKKTIEYTKGKTPSLTVGTWNLISYYNGRDAIVGVINGTSPTAVFVSGGAMTGSSGVNGYSSTYKAKGQEISIAKPALTTNNASTDPAVTRQELEYLAALQLAARYEIRGGRLDLFRADGSFAATFELAK